MSAKTKKKAAEIVSAYCWRSGKIGFAKRTPKGGLRFCRGPRSEIVPIVEGLARLAYNNKTWLVPGIPEADSCDEAADAICRFRTRVNKRRAMK